MTDTTMAGAPSSLRIGQVLNRALALLTGNFFRFFLLMAIMLSPYLVVTIPSLILGFGTPGAARVTPGAVPGHVGVGFVAGVLGAFVIFFVIFIFLAVLGQAATLYGAIQKMRGQEFTVRQSLGRGLARFFPIIGMIVCVALGAGLATLLFVIPGVILFVTWYVALPACVAERLGPIESLKRSAYLTKGNRWRVLGLVIVLTIVNLIVQGVVQFVLKPLGGQIVSAIGVFVWMALFQSFNAIVLAVVYHDLRVAREGVDIEHIAAVFD